MISYTELNCRALALCHAPTNDAASLNKRALFSDQQAARDAEDTAHRLGNQRLQSNRKNRIRAIWRVAHKNNRIILIGKPFQSSEAHEIKNHPIQESGKKNQCTVIGTVKRMAF